MHFLSISNPFYIPSMFTIQLLHMAVLGFYSLLKNGFSGKQFVCGSKKDSDSLTAVIWIVLELVSHTSLNYTFCLRICFLLQFL